MNKHDFRYVSPKDEADLFKIQDRAIHHSNNARNGIQVAIIATLIHIGKHGDVRPATRLVEALGNGINQAAVVAMFVKYGGLKVSEDPENPGFTGWTSREYVIEHLDDAKAKPWWNERQQRPFSGYDVNVQIESLLRKVKRNKEKLADPTVSDEDKAKINVEANDGMVRQLLGALKFEAFGTDDDKAAAA